MDKISIITVVYNDKNALEKTIMSVISQTYFPMEYIIVDGGSTDGTIDVIKKYEDKINKWISEPDQGIYDAMNKGIRMATGEWVNLMNAGDTFVSPDVLEKVFSRNIPMDKSVIYSDHYIPLPDGRKMLVQDDMEHSPYGFCHQCIIYRKQLHDVHGYYVVTRKLIIGDSLFFYSIPDNKKMKLTDVIIANYQGGGASAKADCEIHKQNFCAELVFRNRSFTNVVFSYYGLYLRHVLIPSRFRQFIRHMLGRVSISKL